MKGMRITRGDLPICEAEKEKERRASSVERGCEGLAEVSREGIVGLSWTEPKAQRSRQENNFHFDGEGDGDKEGREAQISW